VAVSLGHVVAREHRNCTTYYCFSTAEDAISATRAVVLDQFGAQTSARGAGARRPLDAECRCPAVRLLLREGQRARRVRIRHTGQSLTTLILCVDAECIGDLQLLADADERGAALSADAAGELVLGPRARARREIAAQREDGYALCRGVTLEHAVGRLG